MLIEEFDKRTLAEQLIVLGFTPTIYSPENSLVNKDLVENCHQHNMKIIPWTVDGAKKLNQLKAIGVDGIITDYPNLLNEQ